ncbi:hypothetical protein ZIOFF_067173 [Zingiber officinale]|uniref:Uncharacterized protein n=1 Tax=Zingiber officinale TaxID=94328 RepID=A0A8J5C5G3_ZINOF|nr:hypothetical protein ZIOFF_067173 [Zingiber officinale]
MEGQMIFPLLKQGKEKIFKEYRGECKPTEKGGMYYDFQRNTRSVKSTIVHFQASEFVPFLGLELMAPFFYNLMVLLK